MRLIGNLLWFLLVGLILGLCWGIAGLFWCVTIVGIPWGVQCFKFAKLAFFPFGKEIVFGTGAGSFLLNILWLLLSGVELAVTAAVIGVVFCVTIVGLPFGLQCFKFAQLALLPFGAQVRRK
ncbi:MAG TPA: YccF domain-containing protein [Clostridia bacterium]|nr:YccF domain-containing protein [Clostridia bacterium]